MKMKTIVPVLGVGRCLRPLAIGIFAAIVLMFGQSARAGATYITLDNGQLIVFPDNCISSISSTVGYVSLTALDGQVYRYYRSEIQSMGTTLNKDLPVFTDFVIDNKFNHQVITDAVGVVTDDSVKVSVLGIGKWLTPSFTLSDSTAVVHIDSVAQLSSVNRLSFATDKVYTVGYDGDKVLSPLGDGRYGLLPFGHQYTVHVNFLTDGNTAVPRIDINTVGGEGISSKDYYLDAEIIIDGAGIFPSMTDSVKVKARGHYSWSSDPDAKNPYRLKFKEKVKPLGLKKGKNWVLLANNMWGSLLTGAFGMKAGSLIGTAAANHIIPVDLYVNGVYKGNYNFTEKIGFSNNSIDLVDETAATLLEIDVNYDCEPGQKFIANPSGLLVNVHEPEFADVGSTVLTLSDIKNRFDRFTAAVLNNGHIADHVDVDYLGRYMLLNELIYNFEMFNPKSVWCYHENILDDSTKFIFGPVWDFDWAFGFDINRDYYTCDPTIDYYTTDKEYWQRDFVTIMRHDPEIAQQIYKHCKDLVEHGLDELCDYCIEYYEYARPSLLMNRWYIKDYTDYAAQAQAAAEWFRQRANALLAALELEVAVLPGDLNGNGRLDIDDVTLLIDYLLSGNGDGIHVIAADADGSGAVGIDDVTTLIDSLLRGGH